jgi:hypothetical protein
MHRIAEKRGAIFLSRSVKSRRQGCANLYASLWHFFMKLSLAAPESFFPFLSTALGSQASFAHFAMKLFRAAPASGLPSFPTALLRQLS